MATYAMARTIFGRVLPRPAGPTRAPDYDDNTDLLQTWDVSPERVYSYPSSFRGVFCDEIIVLQPPRNDRNRCFPWGPGMSWQVGLANEPELSYKDANLDRLCQVCYRYQVQARVISIGIAGRLVITGEQIS